jgi:predicted dehydrogenase
MTVVGDKRMAVWDDMNPLEMIRVYDKGFHQPPYYDTFGEFQISLRDADVTIPKLEMFEPLRRQAEHFVTCVREERRPLSDGRNGLSVVRVLEAAMESLRHQGRSVRINRPSRR